MSESRMLKSKPREDAPATPLLVTQASASLNPAAHAAPANVIGGSSKHSVDKKTASKLVFFFPLFTDIFYDNYVHSNSLKISLSTYMLFLLFMCSD